MSDATVERRLRQFLLVVSGAIFAGSTLELWFVGHTESAVQLAPFVLNALGLCAVAAALRSPRRRVLLSLRVVMIAVTLGSLFGLYQHLRHNVDFELEIRPNASLGDVFWTALGGANPLLAPGILGLAAVLATAATYYHPALVAARNKSATDE